MSKYQEVSEVLLEAAQIIDKILNGPDDEMHRVNLTQFLRRKADYILLITGTGDITTQETTILGPAKSIGGVAIAKIPKITEADTILSTDKVLILKQQIEEATDDFYTLDAESLLAITDDVVVRGLAKKVGIKVTKDDPKVITVDFINQIKDKMKEPKDFVQLEIDKSKISELTETEEQQKPQVEIPQVPAPVVSDDLTSKITEAVAGKVDEAKATPLFNEGASKEAVEVKAKPATSADIAKEPKTPKSGK